VTTRYRSPARVFFLQAAPTSDTRDNPAHPYSVSIEPEESPSTAQKAEWVLVKFIGLLWTALALSLGAPFWFDVLSKIMNVRGAGEKPAKATA
jgi:hypothetical protein